MPRYLTALLIVATHALAGCGLVLDLDPPDDAGTGFDAGMGQLDAATVDATVRVDATPVDTGPPPDCTSDDECAPPGPCDGGETCVGGQCFGVDILITCADDGVDCTLETCSEADGGCISTPDDSMCPDPTDPTDCRVGRCDPDRGCVLAPVRALCDDSIACTIDSCNGDSGRCVHTSDDEVCVGLIGDGSYCDPEENAEGCAPVVCSPGDACPTPTGECVSAVECRAGVCVPVLDPDGSDCNDHDPCTPASVCMTGLCEGRGRMDCDDGNRCTNDACMNVGGVATCRNPPAAGTDGTGCDPGGSCITGACDTGVCVPGPSFCATDLSTCTFGNCTDVVGGTDTCRFETPCADQNRSCLVGGPGGCGSCLSGFYDCGSGVACCPSVDAGPTISRDAGTSPLADASVVPMCGGGADCSGSESCCTGQCVDLDDNMGNLPCGACSVLCGSNQICLSGSCTSAP